MWQNAAGPAVRTLEDSSCSTKLFWQQCGQSISHCVSVPLSHRVTQSFAHSFTCSLLFFVMPDECFLLPFTCLIVFTVTMPHPPHSSASSSLPYVIQSHRSLTCRLSHARAQPRASLLYRSADSAHSSSSPLLLLSLTPFLLLINQCLL